MATPFLDELDQAQKICDGALFLTPGFLGPPEADESFRLFDNDEQFPWDLKPRLYGQRLPQHSYLYKRYKKKAGANSLQGLQKLEELCARIEERFDGEISDVFCNRFQDPTHFIEWHKDTYGKHIFVLSLGSTRQIQFRDNKTKQVDEFVPAAGDIYFMPLRTNSTHKHQVMPAADGEGTRISFVFFFQQPKYAKQYRITAMDAVRGAWESMLE